MLLLIVAAAAFLRFYNLAGTSLSNDELSALSRLRFTHFDDLIWQGVAVDGHPAGVQVFLFFLSKIFDLNDYLLRAPFAWWGIFTVLATFAWCKLWFGKWPAYFTAASVAFLQFSVFYNQLARPYSPGLLFSMLILYHFTRVVLNKNHERNWLYWLRYIGFSVLCSYVHYFSLLFAILVAIAGFFMLPKDKIRYHIIACCIIILLCLPHMPVYWHQMQIGGLGWLGKPGLDFLSHYIFYIFNNSWLVLICALLLSLTGFIYTRRRKWFRRFHLLALFLFFLPFLIGFLKSYFGKPVLQYSVLLFSYPLLPAFIFSHVGRIRISEKAKYVLLAAWSSILIFSLLVEKKYYQKEHYAQFKPLATKLIKWNDSLSQENITYAININNPYYIQYYSPDSQDLTNIKIYRCDDYIKLDSLFQIVQNSNTKYFGYAWSNINNLPEAEDIIKLKYNHLVSKETHFQSEIKLFERTSNFISPKLELHDSASKNLFEIPYKQVIKNALLRVECEVELSSLSSEIDVVASIENEGKVNFWKTTRIENYFEPNQPKAKVIWFAQLPENTSPGDMLKIYIWNRTEARMQVRNFAVWLY
ncbi:MAG: glycosyltransferase family 39 protein [Bacteroidia bacterium]